MKHLGYPITLLCACLLAATPGLSAQPKKAGSPEPSRVVVYKTVERKTKKYPLKLHIFNPPNHDPKGKSPCIVLFHSGGWSSGDPSSYFQACAQYASRGMVAISVEYSIRQVHQGSPFDSVTDGKSAMRWVRGNARELGVDPERIAAGGSSAGGQIAAATAFLKDFNEKGEDLRVSPKPNALVLTSPVFDNGPDGYGHSRVKERWKDFSPAHNIAKGAPPTLICMGDSEPTYISVKAADAFQRKMRSLGARCELVVLEGMEHSKRSPEHSARIKKETDKFLISLGYL